MYYRPWSSETSQNKTSKTPKTSLMPQDAISHSNNFFCLPAPEKVSEGRPSPSFQAMGMAWRGEAVAWARGGSVAKLARQPFFWFRGQIQHLRPMLTLPLAFITDGCWIRIVALLFLLFMAGPVKVKVLYPSSPTGTSHGAAHEGLNWPACLCNTEAISMFRKCSLSPDLSVHRLCLHVPGPSQHAAVPWKFLWLAQDRVAEGSTSLYFPACLAFYIDWIQLVSSHCRRGVSWQSWQADLQVGLKAFAGTPNSHMKLTTLGFLD